jgi:hypothetical protein
MRFVTAAAFIAVFFFAALALAPADAPVDGGMFPHAVAAPPGAGGRAPSTLLDADLSVAPGKRASLAFKHAWAGPVRIEITGVANTTKGFNIYVATPDEGKKAAAGGAFDHLADLQGKQITSYLRELELPAESFAIVAENRFSFAQTITVHVTVTADPAPRIATEAALVPNYATPDACATAYVLALTSEDWFGVLACLREADRPQMESSLADRERSPQGAGPKLASKTVTGTVVDENLAVCMVVMLINGRETQFPLCAVREAGSWRVSIDVTKHRALTERLYRELPSAGDTWERKLASTKNMGDLGKAANTYKIDMKQWPAANGASFWVVLYQNQYVAKMAMYVCPGTGDDNSQVAWPLGRRAAIIKPGPSEVSYAGPRDWARLPRGAANDSLIGADDDEGTPNFWSGASTVEVDGRAKFLDWAEIKVGATKQVAIGE